MRNAVCAVAVFAMVVLGAASSAYAAFEGGGKSPSAAPTIVVGQHYSANLNNHKSDANYGGYAEVAFWRLPAVSTRDVVTVDWHGAPFTHSPGSFPVCMTLVQGIDDFSWGGVFQERDYCGEGSAYELTGSGTAHTEITVQDTTANATYLEFYAEARETEPADYETYPYDFTVGPILHYLDLAIRPVEEIPANGVIQATANLATGQPAPDGLPFNLTVTWRNGGIATYTGVSSGGVVNFQLGLPETAFGRSATFAASHPADGTYQGVEAPKLTVKIAKPPAPAPSACDLAKARALVLTRQFKRLRSNARRAFGPRKRRLNRRAKRIKRRLDVTRREVQALCA
jgi:hypothetical protein